MFAGRIAGRGVVSVAHTGGLRTTYEPVDAVVHAGDPVTVGQSLGVLAAGHPGCPAAACLHWGLRRGALYLDPLALLGLGRVRLLPLAANR
jgi:murein DD-endopeptidase MepM/ murein hydrolase activator NlpD